jgi:hypothetical protein
VTRRRLSLLAVLCLGLAYTAPLRDVGWNEGAHYALVRAIYAGTPHVDADRWLTGDVSTDGSHFTSNKAPGLALASMPAWAVLKGSGVARRVEERNGPRSFWAARVLIWLLALTTVVAPAMLLLWLVAWAGDRVEPGFGLAAAVTLGTATLLLPFATLFFAHVLSALLGFSAFVLLWRARDGGPPRLWPVAAAGALAGLGVVTEYSFALLGPLLFAYALVDRDGRVRRGLAYAAGAAAGLVPLLVYNAWAYGSPLHVSYTNALVRGANGQLEVVSPKGFLGVPSPSVAVQLLLSPRGILILSPVLAMSVVGGVLIHRRGFRAEALLIAAVALSFLLFNAGYFLPFGGLSPGPRFLIPALPFVAVPLAAAYRALPLTTLGLAVASAVLLVIASVTEPLLSSADIGIWWAKLLDGTFADMDVTALVHIVPHGLAPLPFVLPLLAGAGLAAAATPRPALRRTDVAWAAAALALWLVVAALVLWIDSATGADAGALVVAAALAAALVLLALVVVARVRLTPRPAVGAAAGTTRTGDR